MQFSYIYYFDILNSEILYSLLEIQNEMKVPDRNKKNILMFKSISVKSTSGLALQGVKHCSSTSTCSVTSSILVSFI